MSSRAKRSEFLKKCIFANPFVTIEEVMDLWKKANDPSIPKPDTDSLRNQKYNIHVRYGLNSITDFPLKLNGKPNVTELVRSMIKGKPHLTEKEVSDTIARDGLTFSDSLIRGIFRNYGARNEENCTQEHYDNVHNLPKNEDNCTQEHYDNVHNLPKPIKEEITQEFCDTNNEPAKIENGVDLNISSAYLMIEDEIDNLLAKARQVMDSELINTLKMARRHVIIRGEKYKGKAQLWKNLGKALC